MPELRYNVITHDWVIIATERAKRPEEFAKKKDKKVLPVFVPTCPFCPGNEKMTPPEAYVVSDTTGWRVRVTPNKFAALACEGKRERSIQGIRRKVSGVGIHEVIVETPDHSKTTAQLSDREMEILIQTYLNRFKAASADPRVEHVTLFKNHGEAAGTSLEHPHSQLIGTPVITSQIRDRLIHSLRHFDEFGECVFCHVMDLESQEGTRVVLESEKFICFTPFAALTPFSITIIPRRHMACFAEMNDAEAADLSKILRRTLSKLYWGLSDPDYNYAIRTTPIEYTGVKYYHWYVSIIPRLTKMAGFELGSGMFINVSLPEENAAFLRGITVE
ncbi:MAG: galactose-1-phosphate uridylyltransferase [Acidobacteria bacterium]|nr:MAG: galactose-1-phosphate uridylyltransferase [Acidobacteriota bacterium]